MAVRGQKPEFGELKNEEGSEETAASRDAVWVSFIVNTKREIEQRLQGL